MYGLKDTGIYNKMREKKKENMEKIDNIQLRVIF